MNPKAAVGYTNTAFEELNKFRKDWDKLDTYLKTVAKDLESAGTTLRANAEKRFTKEAQAEWNRAAKIATEVYEVEPVKQVKQLPMQSEAALLAA